MTTKAEEFKSQQERSGPKKAKRVLRPHRNISTVDTSLLGVSATDRHVGDGFLNRRDRSKSAALMNHERTRPMSGGKLSR